ncbi:MAG: DUF2274 domain-containing protein [Sphingomonadaceae bacterium]|nr:DUF2274 domain-containing protein [Sphingomonadaceae bacterium]
MPDLKLGKLPDRTPVKIVLSISPALHRSLEEYAVLYAEAYQRDEPVAELIPAMLAAFLESDKSFARNRSKA